MSKPWRASDEDDELIFAVCYQFLQEHVNPKSLQWAPHRPTRKRLLRGKPKGAVGRVAQWLRTERRRKNLGREKIYRMLAEGVRRGFLLFNPPTEQFVTESLLSKYKVDALGPGVPRPVHVVNCGDENAMVQVASVGADVVLSLIKTISKKKRVVHIGLGPGMSSMILAKNLGQLLRADPDCPDLVLHALSSGGFMVQHARAGLVSAPELTPSTFLRFFGHALAEVSFIGLFSETVVRCADYEKVKATVGVDRSFKRKGEIDIIVSSLAASDHGHGALAQFLEEEGELGDTLKRLRDRRWIGEVQFLPYSPSGPIKLEQGNRAVTLFEIEELVEISRRGTERYVVLLAAPCGQCGATKESALRPLLTEPSLRLWTHLVTDARTASRLVSSP